MLLFLAIYMFKYSVLAWIVTIIWSALGLFVYRFYAYKREIEHAKKVQTLDRISKKQYSLLVYLSDESNIRSITQIAVAISRKHNASIIFLYVIELLEGKKLKEGIKLTDRADDILNEAQRITEEAQVSSRSVIKISHRTSKGIFDTYQEENSNFILLDRKKSSSFLERYFSSVVDSTLQKATAEVAVLHGKIDPGAVKQIMIPFGTDIHTMLAVEITPALKDFFNARVRFGLVIHPSTNPVIVQDTLDKLEKVLKENNIEAEVVTITESDILKGILMLSEGNDLIVMGGKTGDFIELLFSKSLVREITEKVSCPVLWLKEYEERESFIKSLFKKQIN
jgi:nucleotide-binding universal stress UspA family protein